MEVCAKAVQNAGRLGQRVFRAWCGFVWWAAAPGCWWQLRWYGLRWTHKKAAAWWWPAPARKIAPLRKICLSKLLPCHLGEKIRYLLGLPHQAPGYLPDCLPARPLYMLPKVLLSRHLDQCLCDLKMPGYRRHRPHLRLRLRPLCLQIRRYSPGLQHHHQGRYQYLFLLQFHCLHRHPPTRFQQRAHWKRLLPS